MLSENPRVIDDDPKSAGEKLLLHHFDTTIYSSPRDVDAAGIRDHWLQLAVASGSRQALFQSPVWWDHVRVTASQGIPGAFAAQDADGNVVGMAPFCGQEIDLDYSVKLRGIWKTRLKVVELMGGEPMLPPNAVLYDRLFSALDLAYPRCDGMSLVMLPTDCYCWRYLNESAFIRERYIIYVPDGPGLSRYIALPKSFQEYLAKFSSKTRSELRRQERRLRDHGGGDLLLRRFETREDLDDFLDATEEVVRHSWQFGRVADVVRNNAYWRNKLGHLADEGLLRSYVLHSGGRPCAVELGYQFQNTFHGVQTYYHQDVARLSPGTVLLYSYLQDLFVHRPAQLLSFGFGDSDYKQMFGNASSLDASVLLLRKTLRNRLRRASHATFRSAIQKIKSRLRERHP